MSDPTERREPHTPAFGSGQWANQNPWLIALGVTGPIALIAGIIAFATGYKKATSMSVFADTDPTGFVAMFSGEMLIVGGALALVGWLVTSALCWQFARREQR